MTLLKKQDIESHQNEISTLLTRSFCDLSRYWEGYLDLLQTNHLLGVKPPGELAGQITNGLHIEQEFTRRHYFPPGQAANYAILHATELKVGGEKGLELLFNEK